MAKYLNDGGLLYFWGKLKASFVAKVTTGSKIQIYGVNASNAQTMYDMDIDLSSVSASDDTIPSAKAVKTYVDESSGGGPAPIVAVAAEKTLAASDAETYQNVNVSGLATITIPTIANGAPPVGSEIEFGRAGLGDVVFSPSAGVTLQSVEGKNSLRRRYSQAGLKHIAENQWRLGGDLGYPFSPPEYIGQSSAFASGSSSISVGVPVGYAQNDLLLLLLEGYDAYPTTPSGWTSITTQNATNTYFRLCYKIAASSESDVSVADSGNSTRAIMLCYRGVDISNPVNAFFASSATMPNTVISCSATTVANCMIVACLGFFDADENDSDSFNNWVCDDLSYVEEVVDQANSVGSGGGIAAMHGVKVAPGTISDISATGDRTGYVAAISVALAPSKPSMA